MKARIYTILLIGLLSCPLALQAQQDTTGLQFTTETEDRSQWNTKIKFQRNVKSIMDTVGSIVAAGLELRALGIISVRNRSIPVNFNLHYEQMVLTNGLSFNVQLSGNLVKHREFDYDYHDQEWPEGTKSFEAIGKRRVWINLGARYYYNKRKRIFQGRSGNNPYGQYVSLNLMSPLAFIDETSRNWVPSGPLRSTLLSKRERQYVGARLATLGIGWGIQQRLWQKVLVDVNVGPVVKLHRPEVYYFTNQYSLFGRLRLSYLIFEK